MQEHIRYTTEYRAEIVTLARRSGLSPEALARHLEPSAETLRDWLFRAELDGGCQLGDGEADGRTDLRSLRRELRRVRLERDILLAARRWRQANRLAAARDGFAFVRAHSDVLPVRAMCRVLGCSSSGFYAWLSRPPSDRATRDAVLRRKVSVSWENSRRTYGRRRIHADLASQGERVSPKRVARLMQELGISGANHARSKTATPCRSTTPSSAQDLVKRDFRVSGRDELWLADIAQIWTQAGRVYLAVVLDAWSRMIVGWAAETHARSALVEKALALAVALRRPAGVVHHSDRGSQYTSRSFGDQCRAAHVRASTGETGSPYDNAMCESFFATLNRELLSRCRFASPAAARSAIGDFIEHFYNPRRRHSALGYDSPALYEHRHRQKEADGP